MAHAVRIYCIDKSFFAGFEFENFKNVVKSHEFYRNFIYFA